MNDEQVISIDKIIENLIYLHPLISRSLTRSIKTKTSFNPGTLYVLGLLNRYELLSMSEIGCKLSMPKPHVTTQIDKLIAEKMVERLFDPNDRRIINIRMTEKGKADLKAIKQEVSIDMKLRIQKLDEQQLKILSESTQQVRDILSDIMVDSNSKTPLCNKN